MVRFSAILKNGLKPEDYPLHFEEIKSKITGKPVEKAMPKKTRKGTQTKEEDGGERKQK